MTLVSLQRTVYPKMFLSAQGLKCIHHECWRYKVNETTEELYSFNSVYGFICSSS